MGIWGFVIVFGALFVISFLIEKRRIRNAIYLFLFICSLVIGLLTLKGTTPVFGMYLSAIVILSVPLLMIVATVLFVAAGVTSIRKEGLRLPNVLSIAFPLVMWAALVFCIFSITYPMEVQQQTLFLGILAGFLGLYVIVTFTALLLYSTFYRIIPKRRDFDFIIIHGAGLMPDGSVTPLLAGRCDKALEVFERGGRAARCIASGGQGADEANSEAQAMCDYLVSKGVPREQVLLEDKSTTTFENMQNSKAIIDRVSAEEGIARPRCVFVTSDYHVLRTATYAMRVGLKADGVGSKTARYYFPNAFIREYVAIMLRHKGPIIFIVILWALGVVVSEM